MLSIIDSGPPRKWMDGMLSKYTVAIEIKDGAFLLFTMLLI